MEIKNIEIKPMDEKELQHTKPALQTEVELDYIDSYFTKILVKYTAELLNGDMVR